MSTEEPMGDAEVSFLEAVQKHRGASDRKWYSVDWKALMNWRSLYVIVSCCSFLLLTVFGIVTMKVTDSCTVEQPDGRCCECLEYNASRLIGQTMPRENSLNSVYYGVVMVVNSLFGIYYVFVGVRSENKYQLFCMLVTQAFEVTRAIADTLLETNAEMKQRAALRESLAYISLVLLVISAFLIRPLYKEFGWTVFRRGAVKHSVRRMYKTYQLFRAFNRLDVQSSALLFLIFGLYMSFVQTQGAWVMITLLLCDLIASRSMVRYLKREDYVGVIVSVVAKSFVVAWWILVLVDYLNCIELFRTARDETARYFSMNPYPDMRSIALSYPGQDCLAPQTRYDDRTVEVIALNLGQALFFRVASLVIAYRVVQNFGQGLKPIFIRADAREAQRKREGKKKPDGGGQRGKNANDDSEMQATQTQFRKSERFDLGGDAAHDDFMPSARGLREEDPEQDFMPSARGSRMDTPASLATLNRSLAQSSEGDDVSDSEVDADMAW
jgi:hypothetical protein